MLQAPAYVWLVNDAVDDVEFAERRTVGKVETVTRLNLKPKGRRSSETQLGAEWVAYLGNGTVVGRKKVWLKCFRAVYSSIWDLGCVDRSNRCDSPDAAALEHPASKGAGTLLHV